MGILGVERLGFRVWANTGFNEYVGKTPNPKPYPKLGQNAVFYAACHGDAELLKLLMEARLGSS